MAMQLKDPSGPLWDRLAPREREIVERYIQLGPPLKVGELAAELGLRVTRTPNLRPNISGLIRPGETQSGFEILVNKYETTPRQRFTVAHEIAHYLLHRAEIGAGIIDSTMYRSNLSSRKEVEANQLAASMLMPLAFLTKELAELKGLDSDRLVEELSERFRVSDSAIRVRLGIY